MLLQLIEAFKVLSENVTFPIGRVVKLKDNMKRFLNYHKKISTFIKAFDINKVIVYMKSVAILFDGQGVY